MSNIHLELIGLVKSHLLRNFKCCRSVSATSLYPANRPNRLIILGLGSCCANADLLMVSTQSLLCEAKLPEQKMLNVELNFVFHVSNCLTRNTADINTFFLTSFLISKLPRPVPHSFLPGCGFCRKEHWKLLSSLKTTVEGLVSTNNPNVWSRYGGLQRLHKDMNNILSNGLKNEQVNMRLTHRYVGNSAANLSRLTRVCTHTIQETKRKKFYSKCHKSTIIYYQTSDKCTLSLDLQGCLNIKHPDIVVSHSRLTAMLSGIGLCSICFTC